MARISRTPVPGWTTGSNLIGVDPLFLDPTDLDYHLMPGSPAIRRRRQFSARRPRLGRLRWTAAHRRRHCRHRHLRGAHRHPDRRIRVRRHLGLDHNLAVARKKCYHAGPHSLCVPVSVVPHLDSDAWAVREKSTSLETVSPRVRRVIELLGYEASIEDINYDRGQTMFHKSISRLVLSSLSVAIVAASSSLLLRRKRPS